MIFDWKRHFIFFNVVTYIFFIIVGKKFAKNNNCYYAEVSVPLQLNVDKLLVDITDQLERCYKTNNTETTVKPSMNTQSGKHQGGRSFKKSRFSLFSRLRKLFFKNT